MIKYLTLVLLLTPSLSFASTPDEAICWSNPFSDSSQTALGSCYKNMITSPFSAIMAPFDTIAPGFGLLFIWAPVVFALWFKTKSPAIAGIFGIIIVGTGLSFHAMAVGMGIVLLAISGGISLVQIFQRIKQTV